MKTISLNELKEEFEIYLKEHTDYNEEKIEKTVSLLDTPDIIHKVDAYMSEYVDEIIIDNEIFLHYHCWFLDIPGEFPHETYYLKKDVEDKTVESYIRSHKYYSLP